MTVAVRIANLNLSYGSKEILHNISLSVQEGEFYVIIGPNGSGKTSLLKTIAGINHPAAGTLAILGKPLPDYPRKDLSQILAVVPQQAPEDFPFNVLDTVLMGRTPHLGLLEMERKEDHELAWQAMEFTDVARLADRRLDQLSGGERQRVIIARAICQQPRVILLDEPTASLDPAHQIKIMDLMARFRTEQKTTVIMVSHDLNLAALYGDRLLLLKNGKRIVTGPPDAVLTHEQLELSYGCKMQVDKNPVCGCPRVVPIPEKYHSRIN